MSRLSETLITSTALFALFAYSASATTHTFTINLDHAQAATTGAASGRGTAAYDDVTGVFSWNYNYTGLSGMPTAAHFHGPAGPGAVANVRVDVEAPSSGAMYTDNPNTGMVTIPASHGTELINGLWYLNIHTSLHMGGEIRGQLVNSNPSAGNPALKASLKQSIKKLKKKAKKAKQKGQIAKARSLRGKIKKLKKQLKALN